MPVNMIGANPSQRSVEELPRVRLIAAALQILVSPRACSRAAGPALLLDPSDGKVLYAEDLDNQWHPASPPRS